MNNHKGAWISGKRDYYEVLGVSKTASPDEIKKAFRRAAVEHHPDRGGSEEKFKELNEAYEVLKDEAKRKRYDNLVTLVLVVVLQVMAATLTPVLVAELKV